MIGSMFVGLLVGLLAGALTNRGERHGMLWENVPRLDWCLSGSPAFWNLGTSFIRNSYYPSDFRCHDCLSDFLETRKLIS